MSKTFLKLNTLSLRTLGKKLMQLSRKHYKIGLISMLSLFVIVLIAGSIAFAKREALLRSAMDKGIRKAKTDYNLDIKIGSATFSGLSTVSFKDITIIPGGRDSLADIESLKIGIKL